MIKFVFIFISLITEVGTVLKEFETQAVSYDRFGSKAFLFYEKSNLTIQCNCVYEEHKQPCNKTETTIKGVIDDFTVQGSSYSIPVISNARSYYQCVSNNRASNSVFLQTLCDYDSDSCNKGCSSDAVADTSRWWFCLKGGKECGTMDKDSCKEKDFGYFACLDGGNSAEESLCQAFAETKNVNVMVSLKGFCKKGQLPIEVTMSNRQVYVGSIKKFNETITIQQKSPFDWSLKCFERFGNDKERNITLSREMMFTLSSEGTNSYVSQLFCEAKSSVGSAYFYAYNYRINSKISMTKTPRKPIGGNTSAVMEQDFVCEFESPPKDKKFHPTIVATLDGTIIHKKNDTKLNFTSSTFGEYKCTGSIKFIHCNPYYTATESSSSDVMYTTSTTSTSTSTPTSTSDLSTVRKDSTAKHSDQTSEKSTRGNMKLVIMVACIGGIVVFLVIITLLIWCCVNRKRRGHKKEARNVNSKSDSLHKKRISHDSHNLHVKLMADRHESRSPSKESRHKSKGKRKQRPSSQSESRSMSSNLSHESAAPPNRSELPSYFKEPVKKPSRHS